MNILEQIVVIFREIFIDDSIVLSRATTANEIDGWDSFAHLNIIISLEDRFNISIVDEEVPALKSIEDMVVLIEAKLSERMQEA